MVYWEKNVFKKFLALLLTTRFYNGMIDNYGQMTNSQVG